MIERDFVAQRLKEFQIQEFITSSLGKVGHSHTKMLKTPLGEKIVITASRPGLVVGRKGANIKDLTKALKKQFNLENPQIEINEVENIHLDANVVAEMIASSLERFGTSKFKGIGHKVMADVLAAGALGIEILISGKIPGARAKVWRFYQGYLKKCGDIALVGVRKAYTQAQLKSGVVGVQVRIMPSDLKLPDDIKLIEDVANVEDAAKSEVKEEEKKEKEEKKPTVKKKSDEKEVKKDVTSEEVPVEEKEEEEIPENA